VLRPADQPGVDRVDFKVARSADLDYFAARITADLLLGANRWRNTLCRHELQCASALMAGLNLTAEFYNRSVQWQDCVRSGCLTAKLCGSAPARADVGANIKNFAPLTETR
jgi:hypothetical protein